MSNDSRFVIVSAVFMQECIMHGKNGMDENSGSKSSYAAVLLSGWRKPALAIVSALFSVVLGAFLVMLSASAP